MLLISMKSTIYVQGEHLFYAFLMGDACRTLENVSNQKTIFQVYIQACFSMKAAQVRHR